MGGFTNKPRVSQTRHVLSLQHVSEIVGAISAPARATILQRDVVRVAHVEGRGGMRLETWIGGGRPVVPHCAGIFRPAIERDVHPLQRDIADAALRAAADAHAVLGAARDVFDAHVGNAPNLCLLRPRQSRERNPLAAAPPWRRMIPRCESDIAKQHVAHVALIAQLDRAPAAAALDFTALESNAADVADGFGPDLDARVLRLEHAIAYRN